MDAAIKIEGYEFTDRELMLIVNCIDYYSSEKQGGLPGHGLMLLVAKLALISDLEIIGRPEMQ